MKEIKVNDIVLCHLDGYKKETGKVIEICKDLHHGYTEAHYKIKTLGGEIIYLTQDHVCMIDKQYKVDCLYLKMAFIWAMNSYAIRRKVGALVVKDKMIISDGYNGTPSGFENVCEDLFLNDIRVHRNNDPLHPLRPLTKEEEQAGFKLVTKSCVLHAEANAITKLAKSHNSSEGATLYVTDEPCMNCSKLIIQAGIVRVVYCRDYHDHGGIDLLKRAKIEIQQITSEELEMDLC